MLLNSEHTLSKYKISRSQEIHFGDALHLNLHPSFSFFRFVKFVKFFENWSSFLTNIGTNYVSVKFIPVHTI